MNVKDLKEALAQMPDDAKVSVNLSGEYETYGAINATAETDMRDGTLHLVVVADPKPDSESTRDFEPHPAYESTINAWIYD